MRIWSENLSRAKALPVQKSAQRVELALALAAAVQAEARYGARQDTRSELEQRWLRIADMILGTADAR